MATASYSVHKCLDEHVQPQTWGHDIPFDSLRVSLFPPGEKRMPRTTWRAQFCRGFVVKQPEWWFQTFLLLIRQPQGKSERVPF